MALALPDAPTARESSAAPLRLPAGPRPAESAPRPAPAEAAQPRPAPADRGLQVVEYAAAELPATLAAEWDELAAAAAVPNVFYERWNLHPALTRFRGEADVRLVGVYAAGSTPAAPPQLCGLFPLVRARSSRVSIPVWRLWGHRYCYLQTPLIRRGCERPVLHALCDWTAARPRSPRILDWSLIDGEGPFAQALIDVLRERQLLHYVVDRYNRALLQRHDDWEQAVGTHLSRHHQRELQRLRRRLAEQGPLTLRTPANADEVPAWTDAFLRLEADGWKGAAQTALSAEPVTRDYFHELVRAGFDAGRVQMLGLFLGDEPVALKVNLHAGDGSFAFKIAYQERLAKFSPGVQLELDNVRLLHEQTRLQWMDSCAVAGHFMINRLWSGRRTLQRVLIAAGGRTANLAVGALPLCQALKRSVLNRRPADTDQSPK